jgi:hypothetical protein
MGLTAILVILMSVGCLGVVAALVVVAVLAVMRDHAKPGR